MGGSLSQSLLAFVVIILILQLFFQRVSTNKSQLTHHISRQLLYILRGISN